MRNLSSVVCSLPSVRGREATPTETNAKNEADAFAQPNTTVHRPPPTAVMDT